MRMKMYFNYSIDCELPADESYGGSVRWDVAEASVCQFVEIMSGLGLAAGTTLFVYPDVAMRQRTLYREMAAAGVEIGLHLNGLRYSRLKGAHAKWLGAMPRAEQRDALRMAKIDLEDVLGKPVNGYRACNASANNDTFPLCEELGFVWTSTIFPGNHRPNVYSCWSGAWRYPHHPSRVNRLICGDLQLYEMPLTNAMRLPTAGEPPRPIDLRAETPEVLAGPDGASFRTIIADNIEEMDRRDQPIRGLFVGSHNTIPFADPATHQHHNLIAVTRLARELAEAAKHEFVPSSFQMVCDEARRLNVF